MAANNDSVSYMKEYLRYAVEFEKYVYIWTNAMNAVNSCMRDVCARQKQLEGMKNFSQDALESLDDSIDAEKVRLAEEAASHKKSAKHHMLGCVISLFIFPILCFVFLGKYFSHRSKYKDCNEKLKKSDWDSSRRRQELILKGEGSSASKSLKALMAEKAVVSERQDEISKALKNAKKNLQELYSENVLPLKYRSLNATATLYEYLDTGRCNTVQGHGGIYDTYENDLRLGLIIKNLVDINMKLSEIEANQRVLYDELRQANSALSNIRSSLADIERTNAVIARNTAISAVADQQTAAAAQWMTWRAWANGY